MAKEELQIVITAKDEASKKLGVIDGMLREIGKIGPTGLLIGGGMAVLTAGAAVAGTAVAGLGLGLKTALVEGMEAQDNMAQLDAVLKSTGGTSGMTRDSIIGISEALTDVTKYTDDEILSAEIMLLQFKNIGEDAFPTATSTALDLATRLGMDLPGAAKLLGKALETPGEGLLRLKQAGVSFTDEQIKMITNMADSGKAGEAQALIMDALGKSVGGAAVAAGTTLTGQWAIMRNMLNDTAEEVGTAIIPALTEAFNSVKPYIMELAKAIADFVKSPEFKKWVQDAIKWLKDDLPIAIEKTKLFWDTKLKPAFDDLGKLLKDLKPVFDILVNVLGVVIPAAAALFVGGWNLAVDAIKFALTPINTMVDAWKLFAEKIQIVKDALSKLTLPDWLKPGSPTPLEIGLRGINNALGQVSMSGLTFAGPQVSMSGAGGGSVSKSVIVNINAPVLGFADEYDLGRKLGPIIREQLRGT